MNHIHCLLENGKMILSSL